MKTLFQRLYIRSPNYYYIELPLDNPITSDIYIKSGSKEDYEMEIELRDMADDQQYGILCVEDEPELYWFFSESVGNSFGSLEKKTLELKSHKYYKYCDGYTFYVKSGNLYRMNVINNTITFSPVY